MTQDRKDELFDEMISYLCNIDSERCVEVLREIGMSAREAENCGFFDFIVDQL